jgi:hypothetical protein
MHRIFNIAFVLTILPSIAFADISSVPNKFAEFHTRSSESRLKRECIATKNLWDKETCILKNKWSVPPSLQSSIVNAKSVYIHYSESDFGSRFDVVFSGDIAILRRDVIKWATLNYGKPNHQNTIKDLEINAWNIFRKDLVVGGVVVFVENTDNIVKITIFHGSL